MKILFPSRGFGSSLLIACVLPALPAVAEESSKRIRFTHLSKATSPALHSDFVRDIVQDVSGYVWLATDNGLDRFDGWEVAHLRDDSFRSDTFRSDTPLAGSNRLTAVASSLRRPGPIWIGTIDDGLIRYHRKSGEIRTFHTGAPEPGRLSGDSIVDLDLSADKYLWIATDRGLDRLNLQTESLEPVDPALESTPISFVRCLRDSEVWVGTRSGGLFKWDGGSRFNEIWETTVPITDVATDADHNIWIATSGKGLFVLDGPDDPEPRRVPIGERYLSSLLVDSRFDLWIGTSNGLAQMRNGEKTFSWYRQNPRLKESLADNQVVSIYEDRSQNLWIATAGGGASRFRLDRQWFPHLHTVREQAPGLPHKTVRALAPAADGRIGIATDRGIAQWDPEEFEFVETPIAPAVVGESVRDLLFDEERSLWLALRGTGVVHQRSDGTVDHFRHDPGDPTTLGHDNASIVHQGRDGRIFVGTLGAGLQEFLPETGEFRRIESSRAGSDRDILTVAEGSDGTLWIATGRHVQILLSGAAKMAPLDEIHPGGDALASERIRVILPDANGIVWLGHVDAGLDRLNVATGQVVHYGSALHGLPDDSIRSLVKDDDGFLWVVTRNGIARLNALQNEFRIFSEEDGLQDEGFLPGSATRGRDGSLYFGGNDGFNIIEPDDLPAIQSTPAPILTELRLFGDPVTPKPGGILEKEIAATREIRLPYDKRLRFAIKFGHVDPHSPVRGHFRYRLEGYDYDWIPADGDRIASYSGIPHGNYTFKVQSSVDGRIWPDISARVEVRVTPPWWMSWWFRILSAATLILATIIGAKLLVRAHFQQLQQREHQLTAQRDRAEAELARQLQHHMLVQRAATELQNELQEDQILNQPLAGIVEEFNATHCLIHRVVSDGDDEKTELKQVGFFGPPLSDNNSPPAFPTTDPLVTRILRTSEVVVARTLEDLPEFLREVFPSDASVSLLAARTTFLEEANGIVTLLHVDDEKTWDDSDYKLLDALSVQFGIAIAQLNTADTEKRFREHLERARHEAEVANRAKSDFLAKMTHELRTPLNAIIGFSEILGEDSTLNPRQRETLDIINNSGEHLLDVINEILDLSKIEAGKVEKNDETFSLVPMLRSVYEMLSMKAESKRIGFHFVAGSEMPGDILTDRSKLRQILVNLIGNAIKFTAQGAVGLSVKAVPVSEPEEVDHRLRRQIRLEFEVRDTGRGITGEEIPRLFERYTQTESGRRTTEGTGLGLPIAKSFIELLGGSIEVESSFGEGTTFRFHILCDELAVAPASQLLSTSLDESTAQKIVGFEAPVDPIRILVVEDQPTNRLLLKKILSKAGFEIAEAENGEEAIAKWSEWKPHLILMDEDMPVKRGSEATREILALAGDDSPVIVSLTAYALEQARAQAIDAGCSDFVAKPFRSHELFSVISKHLGVDYVFGDAA